MLQWLYDMLGWTSTPPAKIAQSRIQHFESLILKHKTIDPMIELEKSYEIIGRPINIEDHQELNHLLSTKIGKKLADLSLPEIPEVAEKATPSTIIKKTDHLKPVGLTAGHRDGLQQALAQLKFSHFKQRIPEEVQEIKERDEEEEKAYVTELTEPSHIVPMAPPL